MKKVIFFSYIFLLSTVSVFSQKPTKTNLLPFQITSIGTLYWQGKDALPYHQDYGDNHSFLTYQVIGNQKIALLSTFEHQILIYDLKSGHLLSKFDLPIQAEDFAVANGKYYVLGENQVRVFEESGIELKVIHFSTEKMNEMVPVSHIRAIGENIYVESHEAAAYLIEVAGKTVPVERFEGWALNPHVFGSIMLQDENIFSLQLLDNLGHLISAKQFEVGDKLVSAILVGAEENMLYIEMHFLTQEEPFQMKHQIAVIEVKKNIITELVSIIDAPKVRYTFFDQSAKLSKFGLTYLVSSPENVQIFRLVKERKDGTSNAFPLELMQMDYDYANHTLVDETPPSTDERSGTSVALPPCCTNIPYSYSATFTSFYWICFAVNAADGYCNGHYVDVPGWVTVGLKQSIPYEYGGATKNTAVFVNNINAGKKAGDINTNANECCAWSCATGVDCSGFVGLAWGIPNAENHPYSSYSFYSNNNIATTISWGNRGFGDIAVIPGHVRLITSKNPNGSTTVCEATTAGANKVRFKTYASMSGYKARRRNVPFHNCNQKPEESTETNAIFESAQVSISPTPTQNLMTVRLDVPSESKFSMTLYDLNKKMVRQFTHESTLQVGENIIEENIGDLSPGIYFLKTTINGISSVQKIIKQ